MISLKKFGGWNVESKIKRIWWVQLNLSAELLRVCEKHNLTCIASGGTLLGAIRHDGFIPWDNDMDFVMPRKDYDLLCEKYADEFENPYFLQTAQRDPHWFRGHACLRDSRTTCFGRLDKGNKESNSGIYVDIFPLDGVPSKDKKIGEKVFRTRVRTLKAMCMAANYGDKYYNAVSSKKGFLIKTLVGIYKLHGTRESLDKKYHALCKKYSGNKENDLQLVSFEYTPGSRWDFTYTYDNAFTVTNHVFENMMIPIPVAYDICLRDQFGDYMSFPPMDKRKNDEEYLDPDTPYEIYYGLKEENA